MNDIISQDTILRAVRTTAKNVPGGYMDRLAQKFDQMVAEGKRVELRINAKNQSIYLVEIEQVTVDLAEMGETDADMLNDDGTPKIDFAWADEQ